MFLSRSDFPTLGEADLHGMCVSLNCPVVNIEDLPVGPARGLIVLHRDEQLGVALSVAIRSLETARVALFTYQGELKKASSPTVVMDAALSFAEGMGFLFDEDLIEFGGRGGRQQALRHWSELVGGPAPTRIPAPAAAEAPDLEPAADLVFNDEIIEPRRESSADFSVALEWGREEEPVGNAGVGSGSTAAASPCSAAGSETAVEATRSQQPLPLTKFRRPSAPVRASAPERGEGGSLEAVAGPSRLGRVPIVKMHQPGDGQPKAGFLIRLLGSF